MNSFWSWSGWEAVNAICQIIITIFAGIAILVTLRQISVRNNPKVNMKLKFGLGVIESQNNIKTVAGICITVLNLNIAPLYLNNVGIAFTSQKPNKRTNNYPGIFVIDDSLVIMPGEAKSFSQSHLEELFSQLDNDKLSVNDTAYIYAELGNGTFVFQKTDYTYMSFKAEYERMCKRIEPQISK